MENENYNSVNPAYETDAAWCLSCKFGKKVQVTAKFKNGKQYKYICRFPVQVGDIVIIGNDYAANFAEVESVATTGMFGVVTEVLQKIEIKRNYAAEIDFVFTKKPDKKMLKECAKYIASDSYSITMQYSSYITPIRPITHFARRLLAAASILANVDIADAASIAAAKECIQSIPVLDAERVVGLDWGPPETIGVDFEQVFFSTDYSDIKGLLSKVYSYYDDDEVITAIPAMAGSDKLLEALSDPKLIECVAKYTYFGTFSIMSRGGFLNLLRSFIDEKPPYNDFAKLVCSSKAIGEIKEIKEYLQSV